jgi:hypothetical protein
VNPREKKLQLLIALEEKRRRTRQAPLLHWAPHPKQEIAFEKTREKRIVVVGGGNRSGKSTILAARAIALAYGYHPWEVPDLQLTAEGDYPPRSEVDVKHWIRRADGLPMRFPTETLIVTGLSMARGIGQTLWPKIEDFLPQAVRSAGLNVHRVQTVPVRVTLPNGSIFHFGSAEQSTMMFEAFSVDAALFDEPLPRSHFAPIWRGLTDYHGPVLFAMTPIGPNAPFVYEQFIATQRPDVAFVQVSIYDNPHLSREAVREFVEGGGFTEDEAQARTAGAWSFLTHRAFPQFDPAAHVIAPHQIPSDWVRGLSVDPAHRRPFAMTWAAFGPQGEVVVYREYPEAEHHKIRSSTLTVRDYATVIRNLEGGERIDFRVLDPRFGRAEHRMKGEIHTSIQEDFSKFGLYFDCRLRGTEREETGINEIRELLRWDRSSPIGVLNRPKLRVFNHCVNTMNTLAMRNFIPPGSKDPDVLPEKLLESYKDFCDNLRYLVLYDRPLPAGTDLSYISAQELEEWNSNSI